MRLADIAVLASVPVVVVLISSLPAPTRTSLLFRYDTPTLLTAFAAHYTHFTPAHLLENVASYLLVAPLAYGLALAAGKRRQFAILLPVFLLAFPVLLSLLNLAIPRPGVGGGLSAINAAFVGYIAIALAGSLDQFAPAGTTVRSPALFFFAIAAIALKAVPTTALTTTLAGVAVLAGGLFLLHPDDPRDRLEAVRRLARTPGRFELWLAAFLAFAAYPLLAFPPGLTASGDVVNGYAHLLGFALGAMATYLAPFVLEWDPTGTSGRRTPSPR